MIPSALAAPGKPKSKTTNSSIQAILTFISVSSTPAVMADQSLLTVKSGAASIQIFTPGLRHRRRHGCESSAGSKFPGGIIPAFYGGYPADIRRK
jgi:hypothetical protein